MSAFPAILTRPAVVVVAEFPTMERILPAVWTPVLVSVVTLPVVVVERMAREVPAAPAVVPILTVVPSSYNDEFPRVVAVEYLTILFCVPDTPPPTADPFHIRVPPLL